MMFAGPAAALAVLLGATPPAGRPLTADDCVRVALRTSAKIDEAVARIREYEGRLAEVESIYRPKIDALTYLAPMFTVKGSALQRDVDRDYSPGAWGPYLHLQAVLALPIYSFGRVEAGKDAARARADVERARLREAQHVVALEVRRLYYARLFARSMLPSLKTAAKAVAEAEEKAKVLYEEGTGDVTQVDLMKLRYGATEIARYQRLAEDGAALAFSALKHTMGLPEDALVTLAEDRLRPPEDDSPPALASLLKEAAEQRPEWAQLDRGRAATISLRDAERLANAPVLFVGGQLGADWAPTRDDTPNPYQYDPYNQLVGGLAIGFQWSFDPWKAAAKTEQAEAMGDRVAALRRFAATGIPLQVRKAHQAVEQNRALVALARESVVAGRKWMTFAAAAYRTGTGDAKDLLEGLAAFLQAKRTYYEHLQAWHAARAELIFAVGRPN